MRWIAPAIAFLCAAVAITFPLFEPDMWQHLRVGQMIWESHWIPTTQIWTWPTYGAPDVNPSWGFRVLVYPFWKFGGVWGLFLWRWLTTLTALGLLLAAARRLGARGLAALVAVVIAALAYRERSQIRPETMVAVLLALEMWILETRRNGGPDRSLWLVPLALVWINVHLSYHVGFAILGIYALRDILDRSIPSRDRYRLLLVGIVGLAVSFINPFGLGALAYPFRFLTSEAAEPIYRTIGELQSIRWKEHLLDGVPLVVFGWPLLILWRLSRKRADLVEILLCLLFVPLAVGGVRFIGFLALISLPFMARALDELASVLFARRSVPEWARVTACAVACLAVSIPAWIARPPSIAIDWSTVPVRACDAIEGLGVRGRSYNTFSAGGYLIYRFWPEKERLPFMDIHQTGTTEARRLYTFSLERPEYWARLDSMYGFEWALLQRRTFDSNRLPDFLDADSTWALVFQDDVALVLVRRTGMMAEVAGRHAYRILPAGNERLGMIGEACAQDPALRHAMRVELERVVAESERHATAEELLANLALLEGRNDEAAEHLRRALAIEPGDEVRRRMLEAIERAR